MSPVLLKCKVKEVCLNNPSVGLSVGFALHQMNSVLGPSFLLRVPKKKYLKHSRLLKAYNYCQKQ